MQTEHLRMVIEREIKKKLRAGTWRWQSGADIYHQLTKGRSFSSYARKAAASQTSESLAQTRLHSGLDSCDSLHKIKAQVRLGLLCRLWNRTMVVYVVWNLGSFWSVHELAIWFVCFYFSHWSEWVFNINTTWWIYSSLLAKHNCQIYHDCPRWVRSYQIRWSISFAPSK